MSRRSFIVPALAAAVLGAMPAVAHDPPDNLQLVGDHWTAWNPPTSFPEGSEVYLVESGDTLWDLANRFYGDPYLWPQLWERNSYILDAHWIYPGDPLVVGFEVTQLEDIAAIDDSAAGSGMGDDPYATFGGTPVPLGSEDDIYCSGYIGEMAEVFPYQVVGSEYQNLHPSLLGNRSRRTGVDSATAKVGLSTGDILYLGGGRRGGLEAGDLFTAVQAGEVVRHPESDDVLGRHYGYLGRVRVLSVQETTGIGEIVHSCSTVKIGTFLKPFEPEPVPLGRRTGMWGINDPVGDEVLEEAATVVLSEDNVVAIGQSHLVYLDRGENQDVAPGDVFTLYRRSAPGMPALVLGELAVLSVQEESALARVLESRHAVYVGDRVVPKR